MDTLFQKFSLQNLLRQFFCGVVFFMPFWLFSPNCLSQYDIFTLSDVGDSLLFFVIASVIGTTIYHLEKNLHSYPLQLFYEYCYQNQKVERWKALSLLILIILALVSLCIGICCWWMLIIASIFYFVLAIILLCSRQERLVKTTMNQWIWEEKGALINKATALPICSDERLTQLAAMKKISTWSDFIHCVQSCCFAWIFGSLLAYYITGTIVHGFYQGLMIAFMLLAAEMIIDAHRYRFVRYALQNSCQKIDSQTFIAKTSEREKKSPDESIFTQNDKYDSPKDEDDKSASIEMVLPVFEYKIEPEKINMMTTERLCELLENDFKKGNGTDNKKIVFGILSYVKTCLGDEVLLRLLQKMEKCGGSISWAVDVTNKSPQEQDEIRVPNGNPQQARYYRDCLHVGDKSYLVSAQWYTCKGNNEQTIKLLLDMVLELCVETLHLHIKNK